MSDFNTLLSRKLDSIPDTVDKRPGSIIYDALAPNSAEAAQIYIELEIQKEQTYLLTATGNNLDLRCADFGIKRFLATAALRIAKMYGRDGNLFDIELGSRFAVPSEHGNVTFVTESRVELGTFILRCELLGTIGNEYYGDILPLFIGSNLSRAEIIGTQIPARNIEADDSLRERTMLQISQPAFGGNIAAYIQFVRAIDGVGGVKVFPPKRKEEGSIVRVSVIDSNFDAFENVSYIKEILDPVEYEGQGVGTAPIGHTVIVSTPAVYNIFIDAMLTLDNLTVAQVQSEINSNINDYILSIRKQWMQSNFTNIFISRITEAILKTSGVINVTNIKLNGYPSDIELLNTVEKQYLPYLYGVNLYE